ncbi:MAG: hypothetical protein IK023_02450 [Bacteroidaceae bacterium]|nr:hypothetical protein [Bacteroidaceae bacterium]
MKKIMRLAAALCCTMALTMFSACSDSDDAGKTTATADIKVNPTTMFNTFGNGMTEKMMEFYSQARGTAFCGVMALIYDEDGKLVAQLADRNDDLSPITLRAEGVPKGTYTLVLMQTTIDEKGDSKVWAIEDAETLADLKVVKRDYAAPVSYSDAVGLAIKKVTVNGDKVSAEINPEAAGSIVYVKTNGIMGYNNEYMDALLTTPKAPVGLNLGATVSKVTRVRYIYDPEEPDSCVVGYLEGGTFEGESIDIKWGNLEGCFFTLLTGKDVDVSLWERTVSEQNNDNYLIYDAKIDLEPAVPVMVFSEGASMSLDWKYTGPLAGFADWDASRSRTLQLKPCMQWGASLSEVRQYIEERGIPYMAERDYIYDYKDGTQTWNMVFKLTHTISEAYEFETEQGENLLSAYLGGWVSDEDIVSKIKASLERQGFVFVEKGQGDWEEWYVYDSPDGTCTAYLYDYTIGQWDLGFVPKSEAKSRRFNHTAPMWRVK